MENNWYWVIIIAIFIIGGLSETIRRGFERVARRQREINKNLILIAKQLGCDFDNEPLRNDILQLLQEGQKIKAIKLVRTHLDFSLKEAKTYVDELDAARKL